LNDSETQQSLTGVGLLYEKAYAYVPQPNLRLQNLRFLFLGSSDRTTFLVPKF